MSKTETKTLREKTHLALRKIAEPYKLPGVTHCYLLYYLQVVEANSNGVVEKDDGRWRMCCQKKHTSLRFDDCFLKCRKVAIQFKISEAE